MSKSKLTPPPLKSDFPVRHEYVQALEFWKHRTIALLPPMREQKKEAAARGDQAEVDRLQKEYQEILNILSENK